VALDWNPTIYDYRMKFPGPASPTYCSWVNQVEIWFAKIQRQVIARAFSPPWTISAEKSFVTSGTTTKQLPYPMDLLDTCQPNQSVARSSVTLF
jgi:hypothetical protein